MPAQISRPWLSTADHQKNNKWIVSMSQLCINYLSLLLCHNVTSSGKVFKSEYKTLLLYFLLKKAIERSILASSIK